MLAANPENWNFWPWIRLSNVNEKKIKHNFNTATRSWWNFYRGTATPWMGVRGWSNGLPQQIQDRILLTFKLLLQLLWIFFDYPVCESALRFDLASTFTQRKVAAIDRWGGKKHLSMGYILSNKCAKNCCKRAVPSSTYRRRRGHMFFGTQCTFSVSVERSACQPS